MRQEGKGAKLWECVWEGERLPVCVGCCNVSVWAGLAWGSKQQWGVARWHLLGSRIAHGEPCLAAPLGNQGIKDSEAIFEATIDSALSLCKKYHFGGDWVHLSQATPLMLRVQLLQTAPIPILGISNQAMMFLLSSRKLHIPDHTCTVPWLSRLSRPRTNQRWLQDQDNSVFFQKPLAHTQIFWMFIHHKTCLVLGGLLSTILWTRQALSLPCSKWLNLGPTKGQISCSFWWSHSLLQVFLDFGNIFYMS